MNVIVKYQDETPIMIYSSMGLAAKDHNVSTQAIRQAIIMKNKCCGFIWKSINIDDDKIISLI